MAILKKSLPRRTVLKGLGTTMALPFLDAMLPPLRAATKPPHRFQAFYVPNGMAMEYWTPKGEGSALELAPIMEPLAPYKDQMLVFSGLKASWNYIHAGASGSFLTGTPRGGKNEIEIIADVSIDQLLGRHFAKETQLASLEMSMDLPANAGACTGNLSCAYLDTLSWRSPTQPLPMEWNPRTVFEQLFGDTGSTDRVARGTQASAAEEHSRFGDGKLSETQERAGPRRSGQGRRIYGCRSRRGAPHSDGRGQSNIELPALGQPLGAPPVFEDHLALMMDLQVLAFQSDLTRVISFMLSKEQSPRPYPQIGVPEAHHPLSHHNNIPELIEKMSKINTYHAKLFSQYLAKLRKTPDGDGSLLDHMTILYGAGISNSNGHSGENLPLMLVGGSSGKIKGGRHLKFANKPSTANLLMTIMDKMDYPVEKVGGSTGKLPIDTLSGSLRMTRLIPVALAVFLMGVDGPPLAVDQRREGWRQSRVAIAHSEEGGRQRHRAGWHNGPALGELSGRCRKRRPAASRRRQSQRGERSGCDAALACQRKRKLGHGAAAARGRCESESRAACRRDSADGGVAFGLSRSRGAVAGQRRESECAWLARTDGAHVGGVAEASRSGEGAARASRRSQSEVGRLERSDGAAAARISSLQQGDPARGRDGADVRGARGRSRFGEAARCGRART